MRNLLLKLLLLATFLFHYTGVTAFAADRSDNSVLLGLTGDLLVNRDDPEGIFSRPWTIPTSFSGTWKPDIRTIPGLP